MKKTFLYTALWLMGIMGTLAIWVVSANTDCWTYYWATAPDSDSTYASGIVYWCDGNIPVITIYGENENWDSVGITIKAMNEWLWTVNIWTWESSYWSYYQWWNNFPFPRTWPIQYYYQAVNASWYGPNTTLWYYYSGVFIRWLSLNHGNRDESNNRNLWWWSWDYLDWYWWFNTWSFIVTNATDRQAMCPEGYHIPSLWEWNALLYIWWKNYDAKQKTNEFTGWSLSRDCYNIYLNWKGLHFWQDFFTPLAGFRYYQEADSVTQIGSNVIFLSSSASVNDSSYGSYSRTFNMNANNINCKSNGSRADGKSARCFKNSYVAQAPSTFTLTFTVSGQGSISTWSIEAEAWASITIDNGAGSVSISWTVVATGIANEWYVFSWWLTDCGATVTAACNFTGEFKPITYSVQFTWTDVSWTMNNQDFTYDVAQKLTGNAFTKTGYIFSGWTDWTTGYADKQNVSNLTTTDGATVTLTAQWTPITYTISFSWNAADATWTAPATINAEYDSGDIAPDNSFTLTGYTFTGWNTESDGTGTWYATWDTLINLTTTSGLDVVLYAQWKVNKHKLNFVVDWTTIQSGDVAYAAAISAPAEPKKDCNSFAGWTSSVEWLTTTGTMPDSDVTFTANWNYTCSRSSGWWGGGSSRNTEKTTETQTWSKVDSSTKATDSEDNTQDSSAKASEWQNQWKTYSDEFQQAYEFAYKHGITTMPTIEQANMEGPLTRIAMAKMLSYYAINVLWQKPDETRVNKFNDVSEKMDAEYNDAVTLAYQLWIMWINMPKNNFRPNDLVTRWEFATALSRMLYGIEDWKDKYYSTHLAKLMEEKIITNDDPKMKELRGYVMIMLMRSAENKNTEN